MNWQSVLKFHNEWNAYCKECSKKGMRDSSGKDPNLAASNEDYCYRCKKNTETGYTKDDIIVFGLKNQRNVQRQKDYDKAKSKRLGSLREVDDT